MNNRKARLARTAKEAAADVDPPVPDKQRAPIPVTADSAPVPDKQRAPIAVTANSPDSLNDASNARKEVPSLSNIVPGDNKPDPLLGEFVDLGPPELFQCKVGEYVVLVDKLGEDIAKGKVFQVQGKWHGKKLEELEICVVDVFELKVDKGLQLPYPSPAAGMSFAEAETKLGVMRVLWDSNRVFALRSD